MSQYYSIDKLIAMIDEPNRSGCQRLLDENRHHFQVVFGSVHNHQSWPGGYIDHITEVMNIAVVLYHQLNACRPLPFSLSDLLLIVYLHDIEKPWKYERRDDGQLHVVDALKEKTAQHEFQHRKITEYGIQLSPEQTNGLDYVEGEAGDYSNRHRAMGPLAAVAHMCDVCSARVWFDHPWETDDTWLGATRIRDQV